MSQPDLFVVCKNCGSEVSPYVTECPYCGQRVRKRAPKIDRGGEDAEPRQQRRRVSLPRLRAGEIEGIAPDTRSYATLALVVLSLLATIVWAASPITLDEIGAVLVPGSEEAWRWFTAPFVHANNLGYQFVALVAVALFGSMLERRFGAFAAVIVFLAGGAAGCALAVALDVPGLLDDSFVVMGANGAALALLCAWLVDDRMAARRGENRDNDLIGVGVFAAVLGLLSLAEPDANIAAAAGGAVAGGVLGLTLPLFTRR